MNHRLIPVLWIALGVGLILGTELSARSLQQQLKQSASNLAGQVRVTGTLSGASLDHATLALPGQSSNMQIEQVQAVQGTAQTAGVALQQTGQAEQIGGKQADIVHRGRGAHQQSLGRRLGELEALGLVLAGVAGRVSTRPLGSDLQSFPELW